MSGKLGVQDGPKYPTLQLEHVDADTQWVCDELLQLAMQGSANASG